MNIMPKYKRGVKCAFKDCKSEARLKLPNISFFTFPKDPERCKQWIEGCNRQDLFEKKTEILHKYYRVCSNHFKDNMFLNDLKNRLQPHAIPGDCALSFQSKRKAQENLESHPPIKYKQQTQQNEPSSNMVEACRTCLRLINIDNSPFYEIEADDMQLSAESCRYKLLSIVPEMALNITPKSMLCAECHWSLQALFEFKKKCIKTENIIAQYFQTKLDLDIKNLDLKDVSAFNAADFKISENKFVEVFIKEEVELSDTAIVKHEVDNLSLESVEAARPKNAVPGSSADIKFTEDEAVEASVEDAAVKEDRSFPKTSDLTTPLRIHPDEQPYICTVCGKGYPTNSKLVIHMRSHTGDKPYRCEICDCRFKIKNHLTYHLRTHTGEKPYRCETCDRRFTHKWNLKTHLRVHTGERPYVCTVCGKGFVQNTKLLIHMRNHTNEKPYLCEICDRRFLEKYNLTAHLCTHTGEWPYVCTVCGKGFCINSKLTIHMRSHTGEKPYCCEICDHRFTIKQDLTVHLRKHTGEKPYHCETCDRSFTRKSLLTNHLRIHSSERPYVCTICGQGYSSSFNLEKHTCTNNKEQPHQCNKNSSLAPARRASSANTAKISSGTSSTAESHHDVDVNMVLIERENTSFIDQKETQNSIPFLSGQ